MREDMDAYVDAKGYKSWNDMMRTAYMFLKQIDPMESDSKARPKSISEKLKSIEAKIDDLGIVKEKLELEKELKENKVSRKEEFNLETIPDSEPEGYDLIRDAIIEELKEVPKNQMKEFVLIPYLRKKFPEEAIWVTMLRMEQEKEIEFLGKEVIKLVGH